MARYPQQLTVSLYHTPALRGLWKRLSPPRYNETIGVSHIKAFVFDDDVLVSGYASNPQPPSDCSQCEVYVHHCVFF